MLPVPRPLLPKTVFLTVFPYKIAAQSYSTLSILPLLFVSNAPTSGLKSKVYTLRASRGLVRRLLLSWYASETSDNVSALTSQLLTSSGEIPHFASLPVSMMAVDVENCPVGVPPPKFKAKKDANSTINAENSTLFSMENIRTKEYIRLSEIIMFKSNAFWSNKPRSGQNQGNKARDCGIAVCQ